MCRRCWAFSVALDLAMLKGTTYCDTHILLCYDGAVHDFHILEIRKQGRQNALNIFKTFWKAKDAIFPDWRKKTIGASSNSERKMTGRNQGVVTKIQRVDSSGFMHVWCGAHQLGFCMHAFYLAIPDQFYSTLTAVVAFMRRQQNFILEERSQWFLIRNTCWLITMAVITWFDKHRLTVVAYMGSKALAW